MREHAKESRLFRKSPPSAREREIFSPGKDGEAGDIGFIVDGAGCSQAGKGPLEARTTFPTEPNVLRCKHCGYGTHEDVIKAAFWTDNGLIVVEGIPAWLCQRCGEQFFDEQITQKIEKLLKNPGAEPERQIHISVYDLPQLQSIAQFRQSPSIRANKDAQSSRQCTYCESEMVEELVKSVFWVNEQPIAIENIPAWVCPHCIVQFYDDETAEVIATLVNLRTVPEGVTREVTASVFSLADKENATDSRYQEDAVDRSCE